MTIRFLPLFAVARIFFYILPDSLKYTKGNEIQKRKVQVAFPLALTVYTNEAWSDRMR